MATHGNIYVSGLPDGLDEDSFKQLFDGYGSIVSSKLVAEKRYGFVKMSTPEEAQAVVDTVNGFKFGSSTILVKFADNDRGGGAGGAKGKGWGGGHNDGNKGGGSWGGKGGGGEDPPPGDQVYIKGLPINFSSEDLTQTFGPYCTITWSKVLATEGKDDVAALIQTGSVVEAQWMVDNLNGNIPQGLAAAVQVKFSSSRNAKGRGKAAPDGDGKGANRWTPYGGAPNGQAGSFTPASANGSDESNLYVKGLPKTCDDLYLYKLFAPYGAIDNVKALVQDWGAIAFVKFVKVPDAQRAIAELNQKQAPDGSWIQVSVKQTKNKGEGKGKQ